MEEKRNFGQWFHQEIWNKKGQHFLYIVRFKWVTALSSWAITSAGTVAESAFIFAPLWLLICASVPHFVLLFISEQMKENISSFADTLLVGIPELILFAAIVNVFERIAVLRYERKGLFEDGMKLSWVLAFGIPTLTFVLVTGVTLWYAMGNINFELPMWVVQLRGLMSFWYGAAMVLYGRLGKPQEVSRLREKDEALADLRAEKDKEIADLRADYEQARQVIDTLQSQLSMQSSKVNRLETLMNKPSEDALQAWPQNVIDWINGPNKTFNVDEIARYTGLDKRVINGAIRRGILKKSGGKGTGLYTKDSVKEFLIDNAPMEKERNTDGFPALHAVK
jgi:FtsH-binding integral membrane protein